MLLLALLWLIDASFATTASPDEIASQFSLTTSTSFPCPTATGRSSDVESLLFDKWSLSKGRIQDGASDLRFVDDPFPGSSESNSSQPVLEVTYPKGSFSHDTGGSQFENLWNTSDGSSFQSMLVTYEVAFDENFDFALGGKLPGLRGGPERLGCSGGNQPNGSDCFSTRLMWRQAGAGEVYGYFVGASEICNSQNVSCFDDFGASISRGSFVFDTGNWHRISLLVQLNNPPDTANGNIQLYFDNVSIISQQNVLLRSNISVTARGLYFSTFFGGNNQSWATPETVHSYFRDIRLWGSSSPSTLEVGGTGGTDGDQDGDTNKSDGHFASPSLSTLAFCLSMGLLVFAT